MAQTKREGLGTAIPKALSTKHQGNSSTLVGPVTLRLFADPHGRANWTLTARGGTFGEVIAAALIADAELRAYFALTNTPITTRPVLSKGDE